MRKISTLALFAFLMPLAGCPAGDDTETDTIAETGNMTTMPGTDTGSETTPPAESESGTVADSGTADSGTGPGGAGFCSVTCEAVAECVPPMGMESDYACTDGFCEFIGELPDPPPCDPVTCDDLGTGLACAEVDGVSQCTTPCSDDSMCAAGFTECTGTDDAGNSICAPIPCGGAAEGDPCTYGGTDQFGVCTDGVCSCTDNAECTAAGQACNS